MSLGAGATISAGAPGPVVHELSHRPGRGATSGPCGIDHSHVAAIRTAANDRSPPARYLLAWLVAAGATATDAVTAAGAGARASGAAPPGGLRYDALERRCRRLPAEGPTAGVVRDACDRPLREVYVRLRGDGEDKYDIPAKPSPVRTSGVRGGTPGRPRRGPQRAAHRPAGAARAAASGRRSHSTCRSPFPSATPASAARGPLRFPRVRAFLCVRDFARAAGPVPRGERRACT